MIPLAYETRSEAVARIDVRRLTDGVCIRLARSPKTKRDYLATLGFGVYIIFAISTGLKTIGKTLQFDAASRTAAWIVLSLISALVVLRASIHLSRRREQTVIAVGPKLVTIIRPEWLISRRAWPRSRFKSIEVVDQVAAQPWFNKTTVENHLIIHFLYDDVNVCTGYERAELDLIASVLREALSR
jgi:hypothetical protein